MTVNNSKSGRDSEFALSKFLDEIIDLPIKKSTKSTKPSTTTKTVKQMPLSDVTNTTHHLQKTNSSLIGKMKDCSAEKEKTVINETGLVAQIKKSHLQFQH